MKVAVLQQFLQSLVPALAAAGDGRSAADLSSTCRHLASFEDLDVDDFAAFLERAQAYRASGTVAVPNQAEQHSDVLHKAIERLAAALRESPETITERQSEVANAIGVLAERAGLKGKLAADPKWAAEQAARARIAPQVKSIRELAARIGSPDAFVDGLNQAEITRILAGLDRDSLKAVAGEFGIKTTAASKADKVLMDVLAKLSGHQPPKGKRAPAGIDAAAIDAKAKSLRALVERSANPGAVSDAEIEAELGTLKALKKGTLFEVLSLAGIEGVRSGDSTAEMLQRVRSRLMAAKRARERAEV
jgi:hypothetical protein